MLPTAGTVTESDLLSHNDTDTYLEYSTDQIGLLATATERVAYYTVTRDSGYVVLQYWFFYAYNGSLWTDGCHQGDWECVTLYFRESDGQPAYVGLSTHHTMTRRTWTKVEKWLDNGHLTQRPVFYVTEGTHGLYFWYGVSEPWTGNLTS